MTLPDDQKFLARCSIVARTNIAHPAIAAIKPFDNSEPERPRTLDYATTHINLPCPR